MDRRGVRLDGRPLRPPADAVTVRVRDGEPLIVEGPFAASAEHSRSFKLLECADLGEAIGLASRAPHGGPPGHRGPPESREELLQTGPLRRRSRPEHREDGVIRRRRPRQGRLVAATVSLDGFIAGPDDAMGWVFDRFRARIRRSRRSSRAQEPCSPAGEGYSTSGRRAASGPRWRKPFGGGWSGAQFVLTSACARPGRRQHPAVRRHPRRRGTRAHARPGKDLNVIGADVARQLPRRRG